MFDTKDKILDMAQRLIGEQGYAATSVRHIVAEAGVNLAAIHYHFGSKEELLDAIIARKAGPMNEQRLARLEQMEKAAGNRAVPVRLLLEAFLVPMAERADQDPGFVKLMGRMMAEGLLVAVVQKHFHVVVDRFTMALRRAMPQVTDQEFRWRIHFMFGAMSHTMMFGQRNDVTGMGADRGDFQGRIDRLVTFLTAGFEAPATESGAKQ
ncbi:MAG TPA: TetR/AcrR family transcriptional regulator [Candidatus Sulfopaludibacter sp.]|nr:TetR/AcrR family transcriptional regulator [Candidatus Sulfopaludibacter sp.]